LPPPFVVVFAVAVVLTAVFVLAVILSEAKNPRISEGSEATRAPSLPIHPNNAAQSNRKAAESL
jgi:hypothetical protein